MARMRPVPRWFQPLHYLQPSSEKTGFRSFYVQIFFNLRRYVAAMRHPSGNNQNNSRNNFNNNTNNNSNKNNNNCGNKYTLREDRFLWRLSPLSTATAAAAGDRGASLPSSAPAGSPSPCALLLTFPADGKRTRSSLPPLTFILVQFQSLAM